MNLVQMSVSAGIMIIAIIIIRALAINYLPKKTFLVLWVLALLRLLVPLSIPSPFSVYSLLHRTQAPQQIVELPATDFSPFIFSPDGGNALVDAPTTVSLSPWTTIWLIGAALCALYFILSYYRFHYQFLGSLPVTNNFVLKWLTEHQLKRCLEIRQSSQLNTPLTYGILRPVILMPKQTDWTEQKKICYILQHEYVHVCRFDVATKILLTVALCIHWYNPLVWMMYVLANRDLELSCDEAVVRSFGETTKSAYALTLIHMEAQKSGFIPFTNSFSKNATEERIEAIMKMKKTTIVSFVTASFLVVGIATAFATSALADTHPISQTATSAGTTIDHVVQTAPQEPTQQELLAQYGTYGISFNAEGNMLFQDELVRYFWDGVELDDGNAQAIHYQYWNDSGTVDVYTKRTVIDNGDGSIDPFGALIGIEKYSQADFAQRDLRYYYGPTGPMNATTYVFDQNDDEKSGETFAAKFSKYSDYGIRYEEQQNSGRGNVYYNNQLVKLFIDENKDGGVFTYQSNDNGKITVRTIYDENGKLSGIEQI